MSEEGGTGWLGSRGAIGIRWEFSASMPASPSVWSARPGDMDATAECGGGTGEEEEEAAAEEDESC